ncbi:MAG: cytochrome c biogenesis protein CcsA, partial [Desulfobulbaceae bacterium]|nr:cytochrome c biogenesis protein CcsA [Desulfobulbaceae bacterium]
MNSSQLLGFTTFAYLFSSIIYIAVLVFRARKISLLGTLSAVIGLLMQTAGIGLRWVESYQMGIGHAPLSNMYESLVVFAWAIVVFYLSLEIKFKNRMLGGFAMPFAFFSMAYASFASEINQQITPLVPALQSNWLIAHVVTCFIGYAAFAVACGMGIMYLLKSWHEERSGGKGGEGIFDVLPPLKDIDDIIYKTIVFGFLWLSTGII